MEVKNMDDLKAAFPDLTAQLESSAKAAGNAEGITCLLYTSHHHGRGKANKV